MVGMVGLIGERFALDMAIARTRPLFTRGSAEVRLPIIKCISPLTNAVIAGALPL